MMKNNFVQKLKKPRDQLREMFRTIELRGSNNTVQCPLEQIQPENRAA
jgi:hypothetical protein